ncbi:MAG: alpha/beta hydrolase [Promethearchaeota archaeon]|nr:MAG: alpha/beta hydrolase [Candidatus Lokiarchaeota archaeon]
MKSSTFNFTDQDGIEIFVYIWEPETASKAVVQFIHGLAEHAKRYERVAEALCKEGFMCYANDQRGHGLTAGDLTEATLKGNAGVLGPNGWRGVVNDVHELSKIIKRENPNLPLFLIGHSWGAMLAQDYIQDWGNEIKGCILSGTRGKASAVFIKGGKVIVKGEMKKLGATEPSQKMHDMNFKSNNQDWQKEEGATGYEWLSRNKEEVQKYIDDPWCGFVSPASLWLEFLKGFEKIYDSENEQKIPKDLPVFFISGTLCPIGKKTKFVQANIRRYKNNGMIDVDFKFYQDARHEIFNETNREEVFQDVIKWLNSHL